MRIVIDIMIGSMLIAVVAGGLYLYNTQANDQREVASVRAALQQLQEQAAYHTTVQSAMAGHDVLLVHLHRAWFGEDVPSNALLAGDRPWIDLAPPGDLGLHPPDPVATSEEQASFWYNPTTGTFRARVSPATSEAQTLALYNEVNGSSLPEFDVIPDTSRQPLAHIPGQTPAKQYASMANKTWSQPAAPKESELNTDLLTGESVDQPQSSTADQAEEVNPGVGSKAQDLPELHNLENTPLEGIETDSGTESRPTLDRLKAE